MTPSSTPFGAVRRFPQSINNGSLILQDMLGVGAYGAVYRAIETTTAEIRAVKCLHSSGLNSNQRAFQHHEASLHALVSGHPNIATLHKVVEEDDCLYMVLDCGVEGDLFFTITERGGFVGNEATIKSMFAQIASAVEHCHSMGVYHRDLKVRTIKKNRNSKKKKRFRQGWLQQRWFYYCARARWGERWTQKIQ